MATKKEPWPLLYGGWNSYREWADNGFLPKDSRKPRGRHGSSGAPEKAKERGGSGGREEADRPEQAGDADPEAPAARDASGRAAAPALPPDRALPPGRALPPDRALPPARDPGQPPGGHGTVPPPAPRASPGYFAAPTAPPHTGAGARGEPPPLYESPVYESPAYGTPVYETPAVPGAWAPARREPEEPPPAALRPYVMTSGRTRPRRELAVHALVSTTGHGHAAANRQLPEQRAICLLCRKPRSVAEVSASLDVPLGVARVLIDDMAHLGLVVVHGLQEGGTSLDLLNRVLDGLRKL
ncbi:DUF742 domain-containing protein [Actinomadura welshii]